MGSNVGKAIYTADKGLKGIVTGESERYCAICRKTHMAYNIKWENGTCTRPCEESVKPLNENEMVMKG